MQDGQTPQQLAQQTGHPSIIRLVETNDFIKWKSVDFNEVVRSASAMSLNESNWEATCSLPGMFDNSSRGGETLHDAPSSSSGAEARLLLPEVLPGRNARKHPQLPEVPPAHMVGSKLSTSPEAAHAACLASSAKENKPPQQALDGLHQQQDPGSRQTPDSMRQSSLADLPGGDGRVRFDSRVAQHRADGETSPLRRASDGCGVEDHKHYMASSNAKKHAVSFSREIGQPPPDGRSDFHEYEAQDFVPETSCLFDLSHESSNFPPVQFEAPDELMENSLRHQQSNSSCPSVPSRVDGNSSPESSQREPERAGTSRYHTEELGVQHGTLEAKDCGAQLPQEANNQMHDRPSSSADLSEERQEEKLSGQPLIEVPLLQPELIPD